MKSAACVLCERSQASLQAMLGASLWQALSSVGATRDTGEAATRLILISRLAQFRNETRDACGTNEESEAKRTNKPRRISYIVLAGVIRSGRRGH